MTSTPELSLPLADFLNLTIGVDESLYLHRAWVLRNTINGHGKVIRHSLAAVIKSLDPDSLQAKVVEYTTAELGVISVLWLAADWRESSEKRRLLVLGSDARRWSLILGTNMSGISYEVIEACERITQHVADVAERELGHDRKFIIDMVRRRWVKAPSVPDLVAYVVSIEKYFSADTKQNIKLLPIEYDTVTREEIPGCDPQGPGLGEGAERVGLEASPADGGNAQGH